jgi:hypothetical protein
VNILLVEDHQDTREILSKMLSAWGHEVAIAQDLRGGLEYLGRNHVDAIVSDIALPDGTGYALMSEARRAGMKGLGIAISAYPFPPDVNEPKVTGFDFHLNKPFTAPQLRSLLEREQKRAMDLAPAP